MSQLLRTLVKQYLRESMKNLVSPGLVLRAKTNNEDKNIDKGEKFTVESVHGDCATIKRIAKQQNIAIDEYKPSEFIVTYDELEKLFDLG